MLFGVWFVYTCFGMAVYSTAPLVEPIATELNLSLSAMGTVMGAWPLVYIGMAIPAGALLDRIGVRPGLLIAVAVIVISLSLRSLANGYLVLFLAVALFGVGGPLVSVGAPKLIASWFEGKERGLAIGIYSTGPTIGAVGVLSLTNAVIMPVTGYDWRATLLFYAGLAALAGVVWFAISSRPAGRMHDPKDISAGTLRAQVQIFAGLLRVATVRIVLLLAVGIFVFNHALNNWLPEILRTGGMNVCQGIARGAMIPVAMFVLMETREVDARVMGAAGGLFYTAAETGGVLGPTMTGILADMTGGFLVPLMTLTGVCIVCSILVLALHRAGSSQSQS
jgi:cyanate permease